MNWIAQDPVDRSRTEHLIGQAFAKMQAKQWIDAMRLLESAAVSAPADLCAPITEILISIYVSRNECRRLLRIMQWVDPRTPQATKAALLLSRNYAQNLGDIPAAAVPPRNTIESALRTHVAEKRYDAVDLPVLLTLLAQLRWTAAALEVAAACLDAGTELDEGIIAGVLAALIAEQRRSDAFGLLARLTGNPGNESLPLARWRKLLESDGINSPRTADDAGSDKVLRFLDHFQTRTDGISLQNGTQSRSSAYF